MYTGQESEAIPAVGTCAAVLGSEKWLSKVDRSFSREQSNSNRSRVLKSGEDTIER